MIKINIIDAKGRKSQVEGPQGMKLMELLRDHAYDIEAACGGCCACATCHVYVQSHKEIIPPKSEEEDAMLDLAFDVKETSRLSCQIELSPELDGLEIQIPRS